MRYAKSAFTTVTAIALALALSSCGAPETTEQQSQEATSQKSSQEANVPEIVEQIDTETPAGNESQRILEILNAGEESTPADWEGRLHESFTDQVSISELVLVMNNQLRPAKPFQVESYQGAENQAVTVLHSEISDPLDMTVVLDTEGLITALNFTPHVDDD